MPKLSTALPTLTLSVLSLCASLSIAHAATFSESATPGGDYADTPATTNPNINRLGGVFVPAPNEVNTLTGSLRAVCNGPDCSDSSGTRDPSDAFFIEVGPDQIITSLMFVANSPLQDLSQYMLDVIVRFGSDPGVITPTYQFSLDDPTTPIEMIDIVGLPDLMAGTYNIFIGNLEPDDFTTAEVNVPINWQFDATYESTAPVPLPASGAILLAGLGAFGILRRKRT